MRRRTQIPKFVQILHEKGWLLKTSPDPMMVCLGLDEYIFILKTDHLVYLHMEGSTLDWEKKRYTREPFGDYTTCYRPMGTGTGLESL
jgi:hypothetical protein